MNVYEIKVGGTGLSNTAHATWIVSPRSKKILEKIRGNNYLSPGIYYKIEWSSWNKQSPPHTTTISKVEVVVEKDDRGEYCRMKVIQEVEIIHYYSEIKFANPLQKSWVIFFMQFYPDYHGHAGGFGEEFLLPCGDPFDNSLFDSPEIFQE